MRNLLYAILIITTTSCSKNIFVNLSTKDFVDENQYKIEKLNFVNDSICIYTQEFLCDIDSTYKTTQTVCSYNIKGNYIILENVVKDSILARLVPLPDSVVQQCRYMRDDLLDILSRPIAIDAPPATSLAEIFGFINVIHTDILYYDRGIIYYKKSFKTIQSFQFLMIRTTFFVENGKSIAKNEKRLKKIRKKIPLNK